MQLTPFLNPDSALVLENPVDRMSVLRALAECAARQIEGVDPARLLEGLNDREEKFPTGTPEGVAFPHVLMPQIQRTVLVPCVLIPGVAWGSMGHRAQDVIFAMFGNSERPWEHVRMLARLARVARGTGALERIRACRTKEALHEALLAEDKVHG